MLDVEGKTDGDHFRLVCAACRVETKNGYEGEYRLTATCPSCGQAATLRLEPFRWTGLPATPAV
jgi:hypothetical protein